MEAPVCYICNATRYSLVNLLPLLDLGLKHVAEVVICIGASDPPSDRDLLDALTPAVRLEQLIERRRPSMTVTHIVHPAHDDEAWRNAMVEILEARPGGRIVMNLTGGTKGMSLGAAIACAVSARGDGQKPPRVVLFRSTPGRVVEIYPTLATRRVGSGRLSLDEYLELHGYRRSDASRPGEREATARRRRELTEALAAVLRPLEGDELDGALRCLNRVGQTVRESLPSWQRRKLPKSAPRPFLDGPTVQRIAAEWGNRQAWAAMAEAVRREGRAAGLTLTNDGGVRFASIEGIDFLTGAWFEDWVFHRLKACFEGEPATEVIAGLKLTLADDQSRRQEVLDIDAAVFRDNQLHVVECKTCVYGRDREDGRGLSHKDMSRVADTAHDLVGPYGIAGLTSLRPPPASREGRRHVASLTEAGRAKGVRFHHGWAGVDELIERFGALR